MSDRPVKEKVYIAQLSKEVVVNFITLRDDEWMHERFGKEKLSAAFTSAGLDIEVILAIFFRLLTKDDKEFILKLKIFEEVDGELLIISFDNPVDKLKAIISGQRELTDIMTSIIQMRVKSNPAVIEDFKKKAIATKEEKNLDGDALKI